MSDKPRTALVTVEVRIGQEQYGHKMLVALPTSTVLAEERIARTVAKAYEKILSSVVKVLQS